MNTVKTVKMTGKEANELIKKYSPCYASEHWFYPNTVYEVPIIPNIDTEILEAIEREGRDSFNMRWWHSRCDTSHCRAGWAVHLAGSKGYLLEAQTYPRVAALLIYALSGVPGAKLPDFGCSDRTALADMRRNAKMEKALSRKNAKKTLKTIKG